MHKSKWFIHNWTTVFWGGEARNRRYLKKWVCSMNWECVCRVLVQLNILLICFLEFTVDHTLSLHLSQNELLEVGPAVHKGVHFIFVTKKGNTKSRVCCILDNANFRGNALLHSSCTTIFPQWAKYKEPCKKCKHLAYDSFAVLTSRGYVIAIVKYWLL